MSTAIQTYLRPCLWCRMNGHEPANLVSVHTENSDGICPVCASLARASIAKKREAHS